MLPAGYVDEWSQTMRVELTISVESGVLKNLEIDSTSLYTKIHMV